MEQYKYNFHEFSVKNRKKYDSLRYHLNKTWIIRNCVACGRFCSKKHSKYCSRCKQKEKDIKATNIWRLKNRDYFLQYQRDYDQNIRKINGKENRELN